MHLLSWLGVSFRIRSRVNPEWRATSFVRLVILLLALTAGTVPAWAQTAGAYTEVLHAASYSARTFIPPFPNTAAKSIFPATAVFEIECGENVPGEACAAVRYAADLWGGHIRSGVPIRVRVEWVEMDEGQLGSAGPMRQSVPGVPYPDVWYPTALANAITGKDLAPYAIDTRAQFNSSRVAWYFGHDGATPADRYDFVTVALHELGHGLGFFGSFEVDNDNSETRDECPGVPEGWGCWGHASFGTTKPLPMVFDLFMKDDRTVALVTGYSNPSVELADILQSGSVYFDGPMSTPANQDRPLSLYAPAVYEAGASVSHLDEATYATPEGGQADPNALMTPSMASGEAIHSPGRLTCAILEDIGWEMGPGCAALLAQAVAVEELPAPDVFSLGAFYPNPSTRFAKAVLRVQAPQRISVEVFNAVGQRVALESRWMAGAMERVEIELNTSGWTPGVYFVRVAGETFAAMGSLVHTGS